MRILPDADWHHTLHRDGQEGSDQKFEIGRLGSSKEHQIVLAWAGLPQLLPPAQSEHAALLGRANATQLLAQT